MTIEGLLRLGPITWVNPAAITAVLWETRFEGMVTGRGHELRIYHPAAEEGDYFVVDPECEFDVIKALGIERPPKPAEENAG